MGTFIDSSWTMVFFFSNSGKAGSLFLEWGPIFGGAKLHGTRSIGHDHLAMVVVEVVKLVEAWWRLGGEENQLDGMIEREVVG